ncbi:hypothetical protein B0J14DRAFT_446973, partial [Halenospora varia]
MSPFKNIALWGVGGENIGYQIINALTNDERYYITIIARQGSKSTYPSQITVKRVSDDLSHTSLVEALKDQDVVISAVGSAGVLGQVKVAKAAVEAGVKLFMPSEYGFDVADPKTTSLTPIFGNKKVVQDELESLSRKDPSFSWTAVASGSWLDWVLDVKFADIDPNARTATYWDDGSHAFSCTTIPYVAQGVLQVLKSPDKFRNQRVFMEAFAASQRDIVAELEKQQGVKYTSQNVDGQERLKWAYERLARDENDAEAFYVPVKYQALTKGYGADFVKS